MKIHWIGIAALVLAGCVPHAPPRVEVVSTEGSASSALGNNRWRPIQIGEVAVTVAEGEREPWIHLEPRSRKVSGSGGCNRITGSYDAGEDSLRFGPLASTRMACASMETETAFLQALEKARRYRVSGRTLELLDEGGVILVRLEERNLR